MLRAGRSMGMPGAGTDRGAAVVIIAIALLTSFVGLGQASLWETDEPFYVEASRQMLESGEFLTPSFNGEPRFEKPILFYWMQVFFYWFLGVSEWSARLPAALSVVVCAFVLYRIGSHLVGWSVGLMAAAAFLTMFRVAVFSRQAMTDIPVLMFVLIALFGLIRTLDGEDQADTTTLTRGRSYALLAWASMGLGALTKGPMGIMPILVWLPYLLIRGDWSGFRRLHVVSGAVVFLSVACPWYVYMVWRHGAAYLDVGLMSEVVARLTSSEFGASRGALYYFSVWPLDVMPWTPVFLVAVVVLGLRWGHLQPKSRQATIFAAVWFVVVQTVFALSVNKQPHYIIPSYPAMALLIAVMFEEVPRLGGLVPRGLLRASAVLVGIVMLGLGWLSYVFLTRVLGAPATSPALLFPLVAGISGPLIPYLYFRHSAGRAFAVTACTTAVAYGTLGAFVVPANLERLKPIKPLAQVIAGRLEPDDRVGLLRNVSMGNVVSGLSFVYYTRHRVEALDSVGRAAAFLREPGRAFCLMQDRDYRLIQNTYDQELHVLGRGDMFMINISHLFGENPARAERTIVIVSNEPG